MFLSINGAVVAKEQATISAFDHGFYTALVCLRLLLPIKTGCFCSKRILTVF